MPGSQYKEKGTLTMEHCMVCIQSLSVQCLSTCVPVSYGQVIHFKFKIINVNCMILYTRHAVITPVMALLYRGYACNPIRQ